MTKRLDFRSDCYTANFCPCLSCFSSFDLENSKKNENIKFRLLSLARASWFCITLLSHLKSWTKFRPKWYRRGHVLESSSGLNFFRAWFSQLLKLCTYLGWLVCLFYIFPQFKYMIFIYSVFNFRGNDVTAFESRDKISHGVTI